MISIIIPTYNEEKNIALTLKRLRDALPSGEFEFIVSDASSTDRTVELARPLADNVVVEPKATIARGRNAGAEAAKGEFFAFIDSGLEIPNVKNFFEKLVSLFEKEAKLQAVTVKMGVYPENLTLGLRFFFWLLNGYYAIMNNILHLGSATGKFQMMRASAFKKVNGYDEKVVACEDQDMFMRIAKIGRTRSVNELKFLHVPRRSIAMGWPKMLVIGMIDGLSVMIRRKSISQEWKQIR